MRKCLSTALIFILLAPVVMAYAWREIDSGREEISVTEEVLSGDPAMAEGITLEIASHWDRRLLWETSYIVGGGDGAQTSFRFSPQQADWDYLIQKNADLWVYNQDSFIVQNVSSWQGEYSEIIRAMEEEWDRTGTIPADTVRIGDYYEYYPLTMNIENVSVSYEDTFSDGFYSSFLTDYFHISTGEDMLALTEGPDGEPASVLVQKEPADAGDILIQVTGTCAFAENGFYYSYYCENLAGEVIDRGQEKGIFYFPYRMEKDVLHIELAQVRKVQEQPEGWAPVQMLLDEEKGYLYLIAAGEEGYALFVYAAEGEDVTLVQQTLVRQRETAAEGEEVLPYFRQMTAEQGGLLTTWSDNSFVFLTEEDGICRKWCSGVFPCYMTELENALAESDGGAFTEYMEYLQEKERPFPLAHACVFDGERLVLAGFESEDSLNVLLAVYDESGQRYSGLYRHSSELDADTDQYGRRRILPQADRVRTVLGARQKPVNSPLRITMEK